MAKLVGDTEKDPEIRKIAKKLARLLLNRKRKVPKSVLKLADGTTMSDAAAKTWENGIGT